jgi:Fe-S-cluster containining protein
MKPRYDCSKCPGYCCSYDRIAVTERDIARLARHAGLRVSVARERFTYRYRTKDVDERILRHHVDTVFRSVCRFFDREQRRCTVYEARPAVCRRYPYLHRCGYFEFLKFEREQQGDDEFIPSA